MDGVILLQDMIQDYWFHFVRSIDDDEHTQAQQGGKLWSFFYETVAAGAAAVVILFVVFTFFFRGVGVQGQSMEPTLHDGDWLAVSAFSPIRKRDVVIITQPNTMEKPLVKRVIAMGGDKVDIDSLSHAVIINDQAEQETAFDAQTEAIGDVTFPLVVPKGKVFVLGDNRSNSKDSRFTTVGLIDENYILGTVKYRVYPFKSLSGITIK